MNYRKLKFIVIFMIMILIFFVPKTKAVQWQTVSDVQVTEGTPLYENKTGDSIKKTNKVLIFGGDEIGLEGNKSYDVIEASASDNRIKVRVYVTLIPYEGYIETSSITSYNVAWINIYNAYKSDSNVVSKLDNEEAQKWKTEVENFQNLANNPSNSFPQDQITTASTLYTKLSDRLRDTNESSIKDLDDEELEDLKDFSVREIQDYLMQMNPNDMQNIPQDVLDAWNNTIEQDGNESEQEMIDSLLEGNSIEQVGEEIAASSSTIYRNPLFQTGSVAAENKTVDDIIQDGDDFIETGKNSGLATINQDSLNKFSDTIFMMALAIGTCVVVIWGLVIAIKYTVASVGEKAELKKLLIPYLVGSVIIFGAFGIWKLVITIVSNI